MKIKEIVSYFEQFAPSSLQENYDNSGLQVGDAEREVECALICLDCTEDVIQEAIDNQCDLIISHHPLIFGGLERLTGSDHVQRILAKAIEERIGLYAIHTNLDNVANGVNARLAHTLGLRPLRVLRPMTDKLLKLSVHVPTEAIEKVRDGLFSAGAGVIGNYGECSFSYSGEGSFTPLKGATPATGTIGERHVSQEMKIEVILFEWRREKVLTAMMEAHPYEEVAYDLIPLMNEHLDLGSGLLCEFSEPMAESEFIRLVKEKLSAAAIRHSRLLGKPVQRVALCGGSGSFLIRDAIALGADAFVTADLKYHQFQEPDGRLLLIDAGHYETERATMHLIHELLEEKFPKFALRLTETVSNPIHYA
jgi:dinuclear metal center YbgI/SA1388 family protein